MPEAFTNVCHVLTEHEAHIVRLEQRVADLERQLDKVKVRPLAHVMDPLLARILERCRGEHTEKDACIALLERMQAADRDAIRAQLNAGAQADDSQAVPAPADDLDGPLEGLDLDELRR